MKKYIVIFAVLFGLIALPILFISPLAKYLIEKYDEKYTGRKITLNWAYVNPFTGYIHFKDLKVYESKKTSATTAEDSIFISADGVSAHFALRKMLAGTYEITDLLLDNLRGIIIQNKKELNFDDLRERFTPDDTTDKNKEPLHFNILNVRINNGEFHYKAEAIPVDYFIRKVTFESSGKRWNNDVIDGKISFLSGPDTGAVKASFSIDTRTLNYTFSVVAERYDLKFIGQYLKDLMNYGRFTANLDANISGKGNFKDQRDISLQGFMAYNDFHFGKSPGDDYASFDKLVFSMKDFSPKKHNYIFDSVSLNHPFFKYERYDHLDNIQTIFGKNGINISAASADKEKFNLVIEIARYIKVLVNDFFQSYYKIDHLAIYNGNLKFNDYSLSEEFSMAAEPIYIRADSVDKNRTRAQLSFKSGIEPYGSCTINLSVNPRDSSDFDLDYHFNKLSAPMFNPYTVTYTSFPFNRGTIDMEGIWKVRNGIVQSENTLLMIDPFLAKRVRKGDIRRLPLPLIMAFIRENGNIIEYHIPITGNLHTPKFHLKDIVIHLFENIFIKPPTIPYRVQVKNVENKIENALRLEWGIRESSLNSGQAFFIDKMADFLVKNPQESITIQPEEYTAKEKEAILFFEAKKNYFLFSSGRKNSFLNETDSEKIEKMSLKDSLFIHYLDKNAGHDLLFTPQEKCAKIISSSIVNTKYRKLMTERENAFRAYFKKRSVEKRVKMNVTQSGIPYNGFSFYKIVYAGGVFPGDLIKAYRKIDELNNKTPRVKFEKEREKTKSTFLTTKGSP